MTLKPKPEPLSRKPKRRPVIGEFRRGELTPDPDGGVRTFHKMSTCPWSLILRPHVVQIWSRYPQNSEGMKTSQSIEWLPKPRNLVPETSASNSKPCTPKPDPLTLNLTATVESSAPHMCDLLFSISSYTPNPDPNPLSPKPVHPKL